MAFALVLVGPLQDLARGAAVLGHHLREALDVLLHLVQQPRIGRQRPRRRRRPERPRAPRGAQRDRTDAGAVSRARSAARARVTCLPPAPCGSPRRAPSAPGSSGW